MFTRQRLLLAIMLSQSRVFSDLLTGEPLLGHVKASFSQCLDAVFLTVSAGFMLFLLR